MKNSYSNNNKKIHPNMSGEDLSKLSYTIHLYIINHLTAILDEVLRYIIKL